MVIQLGDYLFADADVNLARPRSREQSKGNNYILLAPIATSSGGLTFQKAGLNGSFRYRYLMSRPANEDYSLEADGYLLLDAVAGYTFQKLELKLTAENLLNREWKEAQFETTSRLRTETEAVSKINFTPGASFFLKQESAIPFERLLFFSENLTPLPYK